MGRDLPSDWVTVRLSYALSIFHSLGGLESRLTLLEDYFAEKTAISEVRSDN